MIHWRTFPTRQTQALALANAVVARLDEALTIRPRALLAVSGGTSPKAFLLQLARLPVAWRDIDITLVDDRWLPPTHAESNARLVAETLLPGATGAHWLPLVDTATSAALQVRTLNDTWRHGVPQVAVLGMGEDGHTASLFPGHHWGTAADSPDALAVSDAPKPPPQRVSLSAARLNRSMKLWVVVAGAGKHAALQRWRRGETLPISAVKGRQETVAWLDAAASAQSG